MDTIPPIPLNPFDAYAMANNKIIFLFAAAAVIGMLAWWLVFWLRAWRSGSRRRVVVVMILFTALGVWFAYLLRFDMSMVWLIMLAFFPGVPWLAGAVVALGGAK